MAGSQLSLCERRRVPILQGFDACGARCHPGRSISECLTATPGFPGTPGSRNGDGLKPHNGSSETRLRLSSQSRDSTDSFRMTIPTITTYFADRVGLGDMALHGAVRRPKSGLIDADFGRGVIKQRTARTCAGPLLSVTRNLEACA